jgi:hypothetical protein
MTVPEAAPLAGERSAAYGTQTIVSTVLSGGYARNLHECFTVSLDTRPLKSERLRNRKGP